jgi:UDP-N-acetylmuramate dehydrogenase
MSDKLKEKFGSNLQMDVPMSLHTTAQVGGPAKAMISVENRMALIDVLHFCWTNDLPNLLLGSGSNVLVSQAGFDGLVILNRAKEIRIDKEKNPPQIYAESGANFGLVARKAAIAGIAGLEWAASIPGTVGGAVYGNAGAHQGDVSKNLLLAEILQQDSEPMFWNVQQMDYSYRSSILKKKLEKTAIISATFIGFLDNPENIQDRMRTFIEHRKRTQPPGASLGSMFKNPTGDYAGRLIEAAGLKGTRIGGVAVSLVHANFFVNTEKATATDYWSLIQLVQKTVFEKFGVNLHLEIEPIGFSSHTFHTATEMGR